MTHAWFRFWRCSLRFDIVEDQYASGKNHNEFHRFTDSRLDVARKLMKKLKRATAFIRGSDIFQLCLII